jgi:polyhydroxyalkanoate depolymerase
MLHAKPGYAHIVTEKASTVLAKIPEAVLVGAEERGAIIEVPINQSMAERLADLRVPHMPPMVVDYDWHASFEPFQHQFRIGGMLSSHKRFFCLADAGTGKTVSVVWAYDYLRSIGRVKRMLVVAPLSGHYATLLRDTVKTMLGDHKVYITDWKNARDIPVSAGKFDIEDYTLYLVDFMRHLGPDTHVLAVCQPVPLTLAATAYLAERDPDAQPLTLTLAGGPVDPDAAPTEVTDVGRSVTMGQLEQMAIQRVGFKYPGVGRKVYPGLLQLSSFMSMNGDRHSKAFMDQIARVARGEASDHDAHNRFYDEYLAVMDMTAEFYLTTVERIFKNREIAKNEFTVNGRHVDIGKITSVAVKTVEGAKDDISAPGQCIAALALCTGLPDSK